MNLLEYFFFTYFFYGLATTPAVSVIFHPEANENTSVSQGFQYYGKFCRPNGHQSSYNSYFYHNKEHLPNTENGPLGLVGHYALENSTLNFVWQIGLFRNIALSKFVRF